MGNNLPPGLSPLDFAYYVKPDDNAETRDDIEIDSSDIDPYELPDFEITDELKTRLNVCQKHNEPRAFCACNFQNRDR